MSLRVTINADIRQPQNLELVTFDDLEDLYRYLVDSYMVTPDKQDQRLLIPIADWETPYRKKSNVSTHSALFCADIDGVDREKLSVLRKSLQNVNHIAHTTHSHLSARKNYQDCWRFLIALDQEYPTTQYPAVWTAINAKCGGLLDKATLQHPELGYYLPSAPPAMDDQAYLLYRDGAPLCVDDLLAAVPSNTVASEAPALSTPGPSPAAIKYQISHWARSVRTDAALGAKALLSGRNTIPVGQGLRNNTLIQIAGYLAQIWPTADPSDLSRPFGTVGWDLLNADDKYPLCTLTDMISRMQQATLQQQAQDRVAAIARATSGARDWGLTDDERAGLERIYGTSWTEHLVAVRSRDYYLLQPDGTYDASPVLRENLLLAARDRLAVYGDLVRYTYDGAKGPVKRSTGDWLDEYGTVIDGVTFDLSCKHAPWDPATRRIYLPACQHVCEPVGHESVHDWLEACGTYLIDMLAIMTHLDRMAPALILTGRPSSGKTLVAKGVSAVYGAGPLDAEVGFSQFTAEAILRCPVLFMDEKTSSQYQREGTTLIRRFLTQDTRLLDEKFRSRVELRGYLRLIVAANSEDVLNTAEDLTAQGREAYAERLVHVNMDRGRDVLTRVGKSKIQADWLDKRHFAEHVLYLAKHWDIRHPGERFAVYQRPTNFHDSIASLSGSAQNVLVWILLYLSNPEPAERAGCALSRNGTVQINPSVLLQYWDMYLPKHRILTPAQISQSLEAIAQGSGLLPDGTKTYVVDKKILTAANRRHKLVKDLEKALNEVET